MNTHDTKTHALILRLMVEGNSIRATTRIADVSKNTVTKLLEDAGKACAAYHDEDVRGVKASHVEADEIWSFHCAKERNFEAATAAPADAGDIWTWTGISTRGLCRTTEGRWGLGQPTDRFAGSIGSIIRKSGKKNTQKHSHDE
mgnify:CR=1 FL=1